MSGSRYGQAGRASQGRIASHIQVRRHSSTQQRPVGSTSAPVQSVGTLFLSFLMEPSPHPEFGTE